MRVTFEIPGEPCGKGRPRFTAGGRAYTPAKTAHYENLVKLEYERQCGHRFEDVPLRMEIVAYFTIPASASKAKKTLMREGMRRPTKKPDADNILKIIADALNQLAYPDDAQIVSASVTKVYAADDKPCVLVMIEEV
jgi:Holliday junction resolvase RusA-like endonuclease